MIYPNGDPESPIWAIIERPLPRDHEKGYLFSSAMGWHFFRICEEAGLPRPYVTCLKPEIDTMVNGAKKLYDDTTIVEEFISNNCLSDSIFPGQHKPTIILLLGDVSTVRFLPNTANRVKKTPSKKQKELGQSNVFTEDKASLDKYAGSILTSPYLDYSHYCIPTYDPWYVMDNWDYRDIQISIDLGHARQELEYYLQNKKLLELPARELITEPSYDILMEFLWEVLDYKTREYPYTANDIETIRPVKNSRLYRGHPGYPYTNSFALSPYKAISYSFWDYTTSQLSQIWSITDAIYREVPIIGQNFFIFDFNHTNAMGFRVNINNIHDTMLRHHMLWPELSHKLQFLTKQYTREPYYKDEGKQWTPKQKKRLMNYNALDTAVDFEVFLREEDEFNERPYLR
jgi:hypothetical protein